MSFVKNLLVYNGNMDKSTHSLDGEIIHYRDSGSGATTLVFVHGWLGSGHWFDQQEEFFRKTYRVVLVDLAGHGQSSRTRSEWSADNYVHDIEAVVNSLDASNVILVGHSMAGAFVLEASRRLPVVSAVVVIDTLKDLDRMITPEQAEQFLFQHYREDFEDAVRIILPQHLFVETTPIDVKNRLQAEFLKNEGSFAINAIAGLYQMDVPKIAQAVSVPVRAINSDYAPVNVESNRKYLADYDYKTLSGTGHYPMLEKPDEFNEVLAQTIEALSAPL